MSAAATAPKVPTAKNNTVDEIFDWIETILYSLFIISLVFTFILQSRVVIGDSMLPTLQEDNKLITSNLFYTPKHEDIVIIKSTGLNEDIVKRIIATEGQTVDVNFESGEVFVDGKLQVESYINEQTLRDEGGHNYPVTVPKDCYFVMGDNRNHSTDSRDARVGFINRSDILGKVLIRISPLNKFGLVK